MRRPINLDLKPSYEGPPPRPMQLPSSGTIALHQIKDEFSKGDNLTDYYGVVSGIPSSGTIKLTDFYGKSGVAPPPSDLQARYDGAIAEEFTNNISVTWKLRNKSSDPRFGPVAAGWIMAQGLAKTPCFFAQSSTDADNWIQTFLSFQFYGLCGKFVEYNSIAQWTKFPMTADNNRASYLVYAKAKTSANNAPSNEWCGAIDNGFGAVSDWYN